MHALHEWKFETNQKMLVTLQKKNNRGLKMFTHNTNKSNWQVLVSDFNVSFIFYMMKYVNGIDMIGDLFYCRKFILW